MENRPNYSGVTRVAGFGAISNGIDDIEVAGQVLGARTSKNIIFIDVGLPGEETVQVVVENSVSNPVVAPALGSVIHVRGRTGETSTSKRRGLNQVSIFCNSDQMQVVAKPYAPRWPGANTAERSQRQSTYLKNLRDRDEIHFSLRKLFSEHGYLHVDTSILQQDASGAAARTFETTTNFDSKTRHLRIAPEVDLKIVMALSGLPKVFEISRNFRNEGVSPDHHPEFTSMEAYTALMDRDEAIDLSLSVLATISNTVDSEHTFSADTVPRKKYGELLDASLEGFSFETLVGLSPEARETYMQSYLRDHNLLQEELRDKNYLGVLDWLFKKTVRPNLIEPIVVSGYLIEQMPLAATDAQDERYVDGFQIIVEGGEIVKAYSEQVDPVKLRSQLETQLPSSDEDMTRIDTRLIDACETGLPPMYGIGWGLDRIHKILAKQPTITEVIPVPLTRA